MPTPDEAVSDVSNWKFTDGRTYKWHEGDGRWYEVEFYGTGSNQYRLIGKEDAL